MISRESDTLLINFQTFCSKFLTQLDKFPSWWFFRFLGVLTKIFQGGGGVWLFNGIAQCDKQSRQYQLKMWQMIVTILTKKYGKWIISYPKRMSIKIYQKICAKCDGILYNEKCSQYSLFWIAACFFFEQSERFDFISWITKEVIDLS